MLRVLLILAGLTSPVAAESGRPTNTVSAGAFFPLFLMYEAPGLQLSLARAWPLGREPSFVASVDTGVVRATGSTRFTGSLNAGIRIAPVRPFFVQLGGGVTSFVERISIVFPERMVSTTAVGSALTVDLVIGFRIQRWELALEWDHRVVSTDPPRVQTGEETLPHLGNFMVWIGRQL